MRKLLAVLLALMLLGSLCGCESGEDAPTEQPAVETTRSPTQEETAPTEAAVNTAVLRQEDAQLRRNYSIMAVNPQNASATGENRVNTLGADALVRWLMTESALGLVSTYGSEEYGEALFHTVEEIPVYDGWINEASQQTETIRLGVCEAVAESGVLDSLLAVFHEEYGYSVEVYAAETSKVLYDAEGGKTDLVLVDDQEMEQSFIDAGYARTVAGFEQRISYLYNHWVLCGPVSDPAGVKNAASLEAAFSAIAGGEHTYISRGDGSAIHKMELSLWPEELGISTNAASFESYAHWYMSADTEMGPCLVMAELVDGYVLTDKLTYLILKVNNGII